MPARMSSAFILLALLAGYADAPPWVQSASADQIALRWYPGDVDTGQEAAQAKADAHCALAGRRAVLVATGMSGSVQLATYECR